jgi:hypothetical protein
MRLKPRAWCVRFTGLFHIVADHWPPIRGNSRNSRQRFLLSGLPPLAMTPENWPKEMAGRTRSKTAAFTLLFQPAVPAK